MKPIAASQTFLISHQNPMLRIKLDWMINGLTTLKYVTVEYGRKRLFSSSFVGPANTFDNCYESNNATQSLKFSTRFFLRSCNQDNFFSVAALQHVHMKSLTYPYLTWLFPHEDLSFTACQKKSVVRHDFVIQARSDYSP